MSDKRICALWSQSLYYEHFETLLIGHMKNWFTIYLDIFRDFSNFDGRSTRLEMWNFLINNIVIGTILILLIGPSPGFSMSPSSSRPSV